MMVNFTSWQIFNASCLRASIHDDESAQINGIAGRGRSNRTNKDQIGDVLKKGRVYWRACMKIDEFGGGMRSVLGPYKMENYVHGLPHPR